mmetsp:Transcript_2716/g.6490  ORF Transcript_2716/g.6490 Transcript_2716/m.6490 type:complete len:203 (+) Transcript_2716:1100-1708(+)
MGKHVGPGVDDGIRRGVQAHGCKSPRGIRAQEERCRPIGLVRLPVAGLSLRIRSLRSPSRKLPDSSIQTRNSRDGSGGSRPLQTTRRRLSHPIRRAVECTGPGRPGWHSERVLRVGRPQDVPVVCRNADGASVRRDPRAVQEPVHFRPNRRRRKEQQQQQQQQGSHRRRSGRHSRLREAIPGRHCETSGGPSTADVAVAKNE